MASTPCSIDLDGVLYVEDEPIPGAREAVERLRATGLTLRFVTNTTARSRARDPRQLTRLGFGVGAGELVTPAALAVRPLPRHGHERVALLMNDEVKEDFAALAEADDARTLDRRRPRRRRSATTCSTGRSGSVMDGAELIALQKNRYWLRADGLVARRRPVRGGARVRRRPRGLRRRQAGARVLRRGPPRGRVDAGTAAMIGDDVESDIGGAIVPGWPGSSCAPASSARTPSRAPASTRPRSSTRSPTCRRSWAVDPGTWPAAPDDAGDEQPTRQARARGPLQRRRGAPRRGRCCEV